MGLASLGQLTDPDVLELDAPALEPLAGVLEEPGNVIWAPVLISGIGQRDHCGAVTGWNGVLVDACRCGDGLGHLAKTCIVHVDRQFTGMGTRWRVTC